MRVSEIINLTPRSIRLAPPAQIEVLGKGGKTRVIPILRNTASLLEQYLKEHRLTTPENFDKPLFVNNQHNRLSRAGVTYILKKYCLEAIEIRPHIFRTISPHVLRHSKAMHMLQSDVNIVYIRDFLGHSDLATTAVYAKADITMKQRALEKSQKISYAEIPSWQEDGGLLSWLNSYSETLK